MCLQNIFKHPVYVKFYVLKIIAPPPSWDELEMMLNIPGGLSNDVLKVILINLLSQLEPKYRQED